jgi:hypothetical protein
MVKSLRKRHLQIWTALLVMLPLVIIYGRLAVPVPVKNKLLQPASTEALPLILKTIDKDDYVLHLRSGNDTSHLQLEWINKTALTFPTAVIYQLDEASTNDSNKKQLVGRIEARGTYRFALEKGEVPLKPSFLLYDFIHQKNIDTLNF